MREVRLNPSSFADDQIGTPARTAGAKAPTDAQNSPRANGFSGPT